MAAKKTAVTQAAPADGPTPDEVRLIADTVARGASEAELALFLRQCHRLGLDPFARQVYLVARRTQEEGVWVTRRETQVSIDGLRVVAARSGQMDGVEGPYWCGPDGVWKDVWVGKGPPVAAKVVVWRKGCAHPFPGVCRYDAYVQRRKDGGPTRFWESMPDVMLAKCAEAVALRRAFPHDLSGLYTSDETGDAPEPEAPPPAAEPKRLPPPPDSGHHEPPRTGAELLDRLRAKEADLARRGLAPGGEVVAHVQEAGRLKGYGPDVARWEGQALKDGIKAGAAYLRAAEQGLVWPAQAAELEAEIEAQGRDRADVLRGLKLRELADLPREQFGLLLGALRGGDCPGADPERAA